MRHFANENVIGATQLFLKKLLYKQTTVEFNYFPADLLYCMGESKLKIDTSTLSPKSQFAYRKAEDAEQKCRVIEKRFKGITIGFKSEIKDVIIEVPLDKDKNFITLNTNII